MVWGNALGRLEHILRNTRVSREKIVDIAVATSLAVGGIACLYKSDEGFSEGEIMAGGSLVVIAGCLMGSAVGFYYRQKWFPVNEGDDFGDKKRMYHKDR